MFSPWLPSVAPGSRGGGGRGVQCRAPGTASSAASGFSVATARSSNVFRCGRQDVAVPLGFAVLSVLWWLPPGGVAEHHHLLFLQHTGDRSSRPATPATTPRSLPHKEKHPGSPGKPLCRRCRATPGVASGSRGGPSGRPCRQARTAVQSHCLCRLSPCPVGFVQNPFVYRAKLNTAASGRIWWPTR